MENIGNFFYLLILITPQSLSNAVTTISSLVSRNSPFEDITETPYFVDKTHLIEHLHQAWTRTRFEYICRPKKFGKSVMLDMVKRFYEININTTTGRTVDDVTVTENYLLFKNTTLNLNISQNKMFDKYFGQYVVICLNFSVQSVPNSYEDIVHTVNVRLLDGFKPLAWVLKSSSCLDEKSKKIMDNVFNAEATSDDMIYSLKIFSKVLANRFNKSIIVLADEVDGPVDLALRLGLNSKKVNDELMTPMFRHALKQGDGHVQYALLTGSNCVLGESLSHDVKTHTFQDGTFSEYCSFTSEEVNALFDRYGITSGDRREEVYSFYNGYKTLDLQYRFANPSSLAKYFTLENRDRPLPHWPANDTFPRLTECFANNELKTDFIRLILNQEIFFTRTTVFRSGDLELLEKIFQGKHCPENIDEDLKELYLSYLFMNGYLTYFNHETIFISPNQETKYELMKQYKNFYKNHFTKQQSSEVIESLECVMDSVVVPPDQIAKLENNLIKLFKIGFLNVDKSDYARDDEWQFHALLYTEILCSDVFYRVSVSRRDSNIMRASLRNDITIIDKTRDCILVVELKMFHDHVATNDRNEANHQHPEDYWPPDENITFLETLFIKILLVNIHGENNTKIKIGQTFFPVRVNPFKES